MKEAARRRIDEFLDLYKQLEEALEEKYRGQRRKFGSVVMEYSKDEESAPVRENLDTCREIRNLLTHSSNLGGEPILEPSEPLVEALRQILSFVKKPPLAMEFATRVEDMMMAGLDKRVLQVMAQMDKNGFSHIPVLRQGEFCGVFSAGVVFRYQLATGGRAIDRETTLRDMEQYLTVGEHSENYEFVPKNATYGRVRKIFEQVKAKNKRVSVIFITENGRPGERLLGMLTPWDVLGRKNN